jgi:hypothetical protein
MALLGAITNASLGKFMVQLLAFSGVEESLLSSRNKFYGKEFWFILLNQS